MKRLLAIPLLAFCFGFACSYTEQSVDMTADHSFDPGTTTVTSDAGVTFRNDSDESHTVTAYEDELPQGADYFSSGDFRAEDEARSNVAEGLIQPGEKFNLTLEEPGTYKYFCIPHEDEGMVGTLVVEE